jgi:hypothetical protein
MTTPKYVKLESYDPSISSTDDAARITISCTTTTTKVSFGFWQRIGIWMTNTVLSYRAAIA